MQWLRKITVRYGQEVPGSTLGPRTSWTLTSENDNDLRMTFRFFRSNRSTVDKGSVSIFNLPRQLKDAIRSGVQEALDARSFIMSDPQFRCDIPGRNAKLRELSDANKVAVFAGYRDESRLIFQGDITDLSTKDLGSTLDTVTTISLGDSIILLKHGYLHQPFGANSELIDVLSAVVTASGLTTNPESLSFLGTTVAGVSTFKFENGYIAQGGIGLSISDLVEQRGIQWFVRDNEVFYMPRRAVLDNFSLRLDKGLNVLKPVDQTDGEDISFRMLIDGNMIPGRGFRLFEENGEPTSTHGYRSDEVNYTGDTHGNPWYCSVVGSRISLDTFPPPFAAITPQRAVEILGVQE